MPFAPVVSAQTDGEASAWNEALAAGDRASFEQFLSNHPDGLFAGLAYRCVIEVSLMPAGHVCSVQSTQPGPVGPSRAQTGNFAVTLQ